MCIDIKTNAALGVNQFDDSHHNCINLTLQLNSRYLLPSLNITFPPRVELVSAILNESVVCFQLMKNNLLIVLTSINWIFVISRYLIDYYY